MNHSILITGAAHGIGFDAAVALAKRGHIVYAATHFENEVSHARKTTEAQGLSIHWLSLDVTDPADVERAKKIAPDILINNAATGQSGPLAEVPLDRVRLGFETNVVGSLAMIQAVVPEMLRKGGGRIVNISSIAGRVVLPGLGPYHMTKFAIEAMSDALRMELAPFNIKVVVIEPGKILTGFNERMLASKWEWLRPDSMYRDFFERWRKRDKSFTPGSAPTDSIVAAILHAVESPKPKTRYIGPKSNRLLVWLGEHAPDRLRDLVLGERRMSAGAKVKAD
jgi:NAD(P)-dependent dehydrogenase (short-subunit alcohol dehydrogenase family)